MGYAAELSLGHILDDNSGKNLWGKLAVVGKVQGINPSHAK